MSVPALALYACALFIFPYAVFVNLVAVHSGALGERAIHIKIIPLAIDLDPLSGNHVAVDIEIIGLFG